MVLPLVNEFAVLGTTFFMVALGTLWYSPLLFGNSWQGEQLGSLRELPIKQQWLTQFLPTFLSYAFVLGMIAVALPYMALLGISPIKLAVCVGLVVCAVLVPLARLEQRSLRYLAIHSGFVMTFIVLGTMILQHWPW